jgi:hypothetical protein
VPYLGCRACGLSVRSRNPLTERAYCPRCGARGRFEPLVRSPQPPHRMPRLSNLRKADTPETVMNGAAHALRQPANIARSAP